MQSFKKKIMDKLNKLSVPTLGALIAIPLGFKFLFLIIVMLNIYSDGKYYHTSAAISVPSCEGYITSDCGNFNSDLDNCKKHYEAGLQCNINELTKTCEPMVACLSCGDGAVVPSGIMGLGESCDDGNTTDGDGCSSSCKLEWLTEQTLGINKEFLNEKIKGSKDPLEQDKLSFCLGYVDYLYGNNNQAFHTFRELFKRNMTVENFPYLYYFAGISAYLDELNNEARDSRNPYLKYIGDEEISVGFEAIAFNQQIMPGRYDAMMYGHIYDDFRPNTIELQPYNETLYTEGAYNICKTDYVFCGNGVLEEVNKELCDDGNTIDGDGCDSNCEIEKGGLCGDGLRLYTEECDDGNIEDGDGCSASCETEEGYICGDKCHLIECIDGWQIVSDEKHGDILENEMIGHPSLVSSDDGKIAYLTYRYIKDKEADEGYLGVKRYEDGNWYDIDNKINGHLRNIESVYNPYNKNLYLVYKNDLDLIELSIYNGSDRETYELFKETFFYEPDIVINKEGKIFISIYDSNKEQYLIFQFAAGSMDQKISIPLYDSANGDTLMKSVLKPGSHNALLYALKNIPKEPGLPKILEVYHIDESFTIKKIGEFDIPDINYGFDFEYDIENDLLHLIHQNDIKLLEYNLWSLQEDSWKQIFYDMVIGIHDDVSIKYYDSDNIYVTTQSISDISTIDDSYRKTIFLKVNYKEGSIMPLGDIPEIIDYESAVGEINIDSLQFRDRLYRSFASKTDSESDPFLTFVCPQQLTCEGNLPENTIHTNENYTENWYGILPLESIKPAERNYDPLLNGDCEFYCDDGYERDGSSCEPKPCEFDGQMVPHLGGVIAYQSGNVECNGICESEIRVCYLGVLNGTYQYSSCSELACPPACDLPWGGIIEDGESALAYQNSSEDCGGLCESQTISCSGGVLSGSYQYESCEVLACPPACNLPRGGILEDGEYTIAYESSSVACGLMCQSETISCSGGVLSGSYQYESCLETECPVSCVLPWGEALGDGESTIVYENNLVSCGSACNSQVITCFNGELTGSLYQYNSCEIGSCGGGGGSTIRKDDCCEDSDLPGANEDCEDYSPSYYDDTCEGDESEEDDEDPEIIHPADDLDIPEDLILTRILAAEMIYQIAIELGLDHNYKQECYDFEDLKDYSSQKYFAVQACLYGYMGYEQDGITVAKKFNPDHKVSRAQILTILSRLLYGGTYNLEDLKGVDTNVENYWALRHAKALNEAGIVNEISASRLRRYETVQYFRLMIDRTIDMLGKKDDLKDTYHGAGGDYQYSDSTTQALQNLYQEISPEEKTRESIANRLKSLLGDAYNSSSSEIHESALEIDNSDYAESTEEGEKLEEIVEEVDETEDDLDPEKTESILTKFLDSIRPDNYDEEDELSPTERLEELFDKQ